MFDQTIDNKKTIVDDKGNTIVDLTQSIFSNQAPAIQTHDTIRMTKYYEMRPDKVSWQKYKQTGYAEMILKYSGISNPFSLCKTDILYMPGESEIYNQIAKPIDTEESIVDKTRNYFKFKGTYTPDQSSYQKLANTKIPSAVQNPIEQNDYTVPYISEDGQAAITIRNGRMYFGEDCGNTPVTDIESKIKSIIDCANTTMADECIMNGMTLTDFVKASTKND